MSIAVARRQTWCTQGALLRPSALMRNVSGTFRQLGAAIPAVPAIVGGAVHVRGCTILLECGLEAAVRGYSEIVSVCGELAVLQPHSFPTELPEQSVIVLSRGVHQLLCLVRHCLRRVESSPGRVHLVSKVGVFRMRPRLQFDNVAANVAVRDPAAGHPGRLGLIGAPHLPTPTVCSGPMRRPGTLRDSPCPSVACCSFARAPWSLPPAGPGPATSSAASQSSRPDPTSPL